MKYKCCDEILKTDFCPHCGRSKEEISKNKENFIFPITYIIYAHGSKEDHYEFLDEIGLELDHPASVAIIYSNMEMEQTLLIQEDGSYEIIEVDGLPIKKMKDLIENIRNSDLENITFYYLEIDELIKKWKV